MKVIVLVVNGLHLGYVGCYGNDWLDTPALDRLAAEGVVFDQHYADCPSAAGARHAWRTGQHAFPRQGAENLPANIDLIQLLTHHKVTPFLIHDAEQPVPPDFAAGWERRITVDGSDGKSMSAAVGECLDQLQQRERWLVWVELASLLPPWKIDDQTTAPSESDDAEPDEGNAEVSDLAVDEELALLPEPTIGFFDEDADDVFFARLQHTYGAAIQKVDDGIRLVLDELERRELLDDATIVLTTDRGLALGEHGIIGDFRPWLHEELVHLPLLIRLPGAKEAGRRVSLLTQSVDLFPTLLETFKAPVPETPMAGRSLWPLVHGLEQPVRVDAVTGLQIGDAIEYALRTPEWSFILPVRADEADPPRGPRLYVKPDDRWEVNDVIQHHMELAEQLEATLRQISASRGT